MNFFNCKISPLSLLLPNSSPPFLPVSALPIEVGPLNPARGSAEHSPSWFWGRTQTEIEFGALSA